MIQDLRPSLLDDLGLIPAIDWYTEARLNQMAEELLADLEKDTVAFRPNYDETREEPVVLPANFPKDVYLPADNKLASAMDMGIISAVSSVA